MNEKLTDDFRFCGGIVAFPIFIIIILILLFGTNINCGSELWWQLPLWCMSFTVVGFCILILKNSINSLTTSEIENLRVKAEDKKLHEATVPLNLKKAKLRYLLYYPIMLAVMSVLSYTVSVSKFDSSENQLISSALLSFFLGFLIDSLPNFVEKLTGK